MYVRNGGISNGFLPTRFPIGRLRFELIFLSDQWRIGRSDLIRTSAPRRKKMATAFRSLRSLDFFT